MTLQVFAAASPAGWPVWVDLLLLIGLLLASLFGTIARASQKVAPPTRGNMRWNMARQHPLAYGLLLAVLMFLGSFWVAATNQLPLGLTLVLSLLLGAVSGLLGVIVGFIVRRSQPTL